MLEPHSVLGDSCTPNSRVMNHLYTPNIRFTSRLFSCSHFTALSEKHRACFGLFQEDHEEELTESLNVFTVLSWGDCSSSESRKTRAWYFFSLLCCVDGVGLGSSRGLALGNVLTTSETLGDLLVFLGYGFLGKL